MAMAPQERSSPLHNFSLPSFKWGSTRLLRCVKVTDHNHQQNGSSQSRPTNQDPSKNPKTSNGVSKRLKVSPLLEEERPIDDPSRPWNLRTRRAACKAPLLKIEDKKGGVSIDSPRRNHLEIDSPRRNGNVNNNNDQSFLLANKRQHQSMETSTMMVKERVKFSVSLAKDEIEEDFLEMLRIRPPRRPKKRPRIVQKYLDTIFPGLWLTEITPDIYKVPELPES